MVDEEKFPDIAAINQFLQRSSGRLMDMNHHNYKNALREVERLDRLADSFCTLIHEMKEAFAIGAMLSAQMTADMIREEYEIIPADELEEEYDEEESEEEEGEEE